MPNKEIKRQYNELRKKYRLPEFKDIDAEFEISDLDETNFLLRSIIRRIAEKLDFYEKLIEEVLQPDTANIYAMHESRFFDEEEKRKMFDFYRRLMALSRQSVEALLQNDEKEEASFINNSSNEWKNSKQEMLAYIRKIRESWKTETDIKEDVGYLG